MANGFSINIEFYNLQNAKPILKNCLKFEIMPKIKKITPCPKG
jgi:hypothetical protein